MSAAAPPDPDLILLIISSPSGAGKTTLTRRVLQEFSEFRFSVSHTTRQPRANEVDGQDYHFVDENAFRAITDDNGFAEWAEVHGNLYGTSVTEIELARAAGKSGVLFDVDYQGASDQRKISACRRRLHSAALDARASPSAGWPRLG